MTSASSKKTAVILLAHGTKELEASIPVHQYAQALARKSGIQVEPCMREFIEPSVPAVVQKLVSQGMDQIVIIPFFLFNSAHVTQDIVKDLDREKAKYPHLDFKVGEPLGFDENVVIVLQKRLEKVLFKT